MATTKETAPAPTPTTADPSMDIGLWEKFTDKMTAFTEWVSKLLLRLFGSSNERYIRDLGYLTPRKPTEEPKIIPGSLLAQINELEPRMQALSDAELAGTTARLREKLAQGATLDYLLPEAFAACRESARRTKNMRHYDVQMLGGVVLHRGNIAEMVTGEGKTLVATLPAFLNGLEGKGVHVVTVNDYLARRDCEWMLPIYRGLGMEAGYIQSDMDPVARRKAYEADITYGTNSEFGFDYLRDNMKPARFDDQSFDPFYRQVQRPLNYAIIDEVDNILIDEARTPLIISGPAFSDLRRYGKANEIAVRLTELQNKGEGPYFEVKEKEHTCHLTDAGVHKAEELAGVESFYTAGNMEWPHLIDNALKAHHLYKKDRNYAVMKHPETGEMSVIIIDEFTGRLMIGRQWSDGLHQAVEAKHARDGVKIKEETQTLATITLQNYFKLYRKLAGMTGTAMTEANEFWKIYKLEVIAIPTNKPLIRVNHPDVVFRTEKEKWKAVVDEIVQVHETGRPVLVGTTDVDKSLKLSEMLKRRGIKHELLNALPEHAAREAEIVAQAGRIGAVTISTNMAGRGTDIILGGNPETMAWAKLKHKYASRLDVPEDEWKAVVEDIEKKEKMKEEGRKVAAMGGLHIVGTERHEARRIDNQLRGRAGRQGDPGSSRFYLSLQDDLMRIFGGEWVSNLLGRLGMAEGEAIESRMVSRRIEGAQKKIEERNFEARKNLLEYDEVMDTQRKRVYGYRQRILDGQNCKVLILEMIEKQIDSALERFLSEDYGAQCFKEFAANRLGVEYEVSDFRRCDFEQASEYAMMKAMEAVETQALDMIEENLGEEDPKLWNWQALVGQINARWGLKVNDRQLKQIGKDGLVAHICELARKALGEVSLEEGRPLMQPDWGVRTLCDWARHKFQLTIDPKELVGKSAGAIRNRLLAGVHELYRLKEVEFPVDVAMATFMGEAAGGQHFNREGLYRWAQTRFPAAAGEIKEEDFHTQSRPRLREMLLVISRKCQPAVPETAIDEQLDSAMEGATRAEKEDAEELVEWANKTLGTHLEAMDLLGRTRDEIRSLMWNAYDRLYRPEMRSMERSLVLSLLDSAWKNHLYTMDHLRSSMSMMWVGQIDAKTEYKRRGMEAFDEMWEGVEDKVTDSVFRMEEADFFAEGLWQISSTIHEAAPRQTAQADATMTNAASDKKAEPIRNRGERVGRNDPCPCGSGKKYKNCHMKQQAAS